ncbi:MAG: hypothetical protein AAF989_05265, partial [Planctomycetota bacterium]
MGIFVLKFVLPAVLVATYLLEILTGIAVAGWAGDHSMIHRSEQPGPYWFVMLFQTVLLFG